jgi:hypothetical protein
MGEESSEMYMEPGTGGGNRCGNFSVVTVFHECEYEFNCDD